MKPQPSKTNGRERVGVFKLYLSVAMIVASGLAIYTLYQQVGKVVILALGIVLFVLADLVALWLLGSGRKRRKEVIPSNIITPDWGLDDDRTGE